MLEITNKTKSRFPYLLFYRIAEDVLGKEYELSLVFIGSRRSRSLNKRWRGKDKPANVLSFPLDSHSGEIFIDLATARRQAPRFKKTYQRFVYYLFIHGTLHLKGLTHGSTMEKMEDELLMKYSLS